MSLKNPVAHLPLLVVTLLFALSACGVGRVLPAGDNPYAAAVVSDTLTLRLPSFEDCMCYVSVEQGRNRLFVQEPVTNGVVKVSMRGMPAGPYVAWIRVDTLSVGVRFSRC